MAYTFKKLADVERLATMPDTANVFVEVDGEIKRAPQNQPADEINIIVTSESLDEVPEGATVITEVNGKIKRVPGEELGGKGIVVNFTTDVETGAITADKTYEEVNSAIRDGRHVIGLLDMNGSNSQTAFITFNACNVDIPGDKREIVFYSFASATTNVPAIHMWPDNTITHESLLEIPSQTNVDKTLSIEGDAADAKIVGDELRKRPITTEAGKQLVTDEEGNAVWEDKTEIAQSDWNVSDVNNASYIINKPFYEGQKKNAFLEQTEIDFSSGFYTMEKTINSGVTYVINFDGTEYTIEAVMKELGGDIRIPSLEQEDGLFSIEGYSISCQDNGIHTVAIYTLGTYVKQIDEKFIPSTIQRVGDDVVIRSSTYGSTKKFKITVDDSGTLAATEVTA